MNNKPDIEAPMKMMENVLKNCNNSNSDCICSARVKYIPENPEGNKNKFEIYCSNGTGGKKDSDFFKQTTNALNEVNRPLNKYSEQSNDESSKPKKRFSLWT